ncbi:hypothetical protein SAMN04488112_102185 [Melghirimyces thermohalophilus]|uniref:Uncharacterized protein n=1 Tax=Melghirimyces thermohalophilus TaxID=1236220 RepID=A0A1G6IFP3_9BACL|nr:hypothetical protein [Melghirimyces thermohalophilus]SDC04576.1 hypothetical protein SAMN04488112_102185 [Melghirimyces thermohalophilus]
MTWNAIVTLATQVGALLGIAGFLISIYSVRLSKKRFDIQQRVEQDRLDSKKKADLRIGLTKVPSSSRKKAFKDVLLIENHGQALARNIL